MEIPLKSEFLVCKAGTVMIFTQFSIKEYPARSPKEKNLLDNFSKPAKLNT